MSLLNHKFILLGGGGHARVVADLIEGKFGVIQGYCDLKNTEFPAPYLGESCQVPTGVYLALGVGGVTSTKVRERMRLNYDQSLFPPIWHKSATIAKRVHLAPAVQIMAGVVCECDSFIGAGSLINSRAVINHDCQIGTDCHIAPGAIICGGVKIGNRCIIGPGAIITVGMSICDDAIVGAGCVVRHPITQPGIFF